MAHAHAHAPGDAHALPHIPVEGDFEFTNGKLAMWLFLISDAMAFIGFLGAYMVLRLTAAGGQAVVGGLPWQPAWSLPMDLILTGINTFVLICSSVTMVKALAAIQDGNQKRLRLFLALTMLGGTFFVGFQCFEWTHFVHEGITVQGMVVPSLDTAMERAETGRRNVTRLEMARMLFGGRKLDESAMPEGKTVADFTSGNFTEADYLYLPLVLQDPDAGNNIPVEPGVIHHPNYGVPATTDRPPSTSKELFQELELDTEGYDRAAVLEKHRSQRARVANMFSSTFYVLTGFHGLHVLLGVIYLGVILFRAFQGAYTAERNSSVEVAGLYWHFVDLVWVLLFMLIYLI